MLCDLVKNIVFILRMEAHSFMKEEAVFFPEVSAAYYETSSGATHTQLEQATSNPKHMWRYLKFMGPAS
jgi:hypothetical protein